MAHDPLSVLAAFGEAQAMAPPPGVEPHEFVGRLDRPCEVCKRPDRNPVHARPAAK